MGKLQKLTIEAYTKRARGTFEHVGSFPAMFNPDSLSQKYEIQYGRNQGLNSSGKTVHYAYSEPRTLNFKLILDGTGVHQMGVHQMSILPFVKPQKSVSEQVQTFMDLTFNMNGTIHEPNFLEVEWGNLGDDGFIFSGRLLSVDVTYTSFRRDGSPLRAELDIVLISDEEVEKRMARENKSSPDLTHYRMVKEGDTLPMLTKEIYGSAKHYLQVAQVNNLDNFRQLTPGQELFFPPLES